MRKEVDLALASWTYGSPKTEAQALLPIMRTQGADHVRELINITVQQQNILHDLVARGQVPQKRVEKALVFRRAVLREFDKLVTAWSQPAVVDAPAPTPKRRYRRNSPCHIRAEERRRIVIEQLAQGRTMVRIAQDLSVSIQLVSAIARSHGLGRPA
jgi:hypothetical protein